LWAVSKSLNFETGVGPYFFFLSVSVASQILPAVENKYRDIINFGEFMVANVVTGREDIIALFWENKLGVDVDVCGYPYLYSIFAII
jgi:hypothetical protein